MTTATQTREHPLLMSGPLVSATLRDEKTQTRRVITKMNSSTSIPWDRLEFDDAKVPAGAAPTFADNGYLHVATRPHPDDPQDRADYWTLNRVYPRYEVGDCLWIRENFVYRSNKTAVIYRADLSPVEAAGVGAMYGRWKPSIHMPRRFSRLLLEITDIRVQRLQEITEEDAQAEGFGPGFVPCLHEKFPDMLGTRCVGCRPLFIRRWDELNGNRGFTWESNPWVAAISFRRVEMGRL